MGCVIVIAGWGDLARLLLRESRAGGALVLVWVTIVLASLAGLGSVTVARQRGVIGNAGATRVVQRCMRHSFRFSLARACVPQAIYCIPCNAERVLKIVPGPTPTATLVGPALPGRNKWYGGLLGAYP
jgi:hypothetical protein